MISYFYICDCVSTLVLICNTTSFLLDDLSGISLMNVVRRALGRRTSAKVIIEIRNHTNASYVI